MWLLNIYAAYARSHPSAFENAPQLGQLSIYINFF